MIPENFPPESQAVPGRTEVQPSAVANPEGRKASEERRGHRSDQKCLGRLAFMPGVWMSAVTFHWRSFCFCYDLIRFFLMGT